MRKILATLVVVVMMFTIMSCSSSTQSNDGGKPVKLVFKALTWIKEEQDVQRQLVDEWNKNNPDIQVELAPASWVNASQELLTAFETGDVPDVFHYSQPIIADWKNRGYLADLSSIITPEDRADVNEDIWAGLTSDDGKVIGVPIQYEVDVTYYNRKIFEEKGITPPTMDNPWTFDQMVEITRKLNDPTNGVIGMAFPGPDHFGRVFTEVWAPKIGDPLVYKDDEGKYYLKVSEESKSFIKKVHDLIKEGIITQDMLSPDSANIGMEGFLNGKYAMIVGYGCWQRSQFINESKGINTIDWGVAAPIKVNSTSIYGYIQTLSVPEASKNKDAAFKFLKWYWKSENVLKVAKAAYIFPGRNSAINSEELNTPEYSWDLCQEAVQHNVLPNYVLIPGWGQVTEGIGNTLFGDYFTDTITLNELIERWETEGTRILRDNS